MRDILGELSKIEKIIDEANELVDKMEGKLNMIVDRAFFLGYRKGVEDERMESKNYKDK